MLWVFWGRSLIRKPNENWKKKQFKSPSKGNVSQTTCHPLVHNQKSRNFFEEMHDVQLVILKYFINKHRHAFLFLFVLPRLWCFYHFNSQFFSHLLRLLLHEISFPSQFHFNWASSHLLRVEEHIYTLRGPVNWRNKLQSLWTTRIFHHFKNSLLSFYLET